MVGGRRDLVISKWRQFWCDLEFHSWSERMVRIIRGYVLGDLVEVHEITRICRHCGKRQRWYK